MLQVQVLQSSSMSTWNSSPLLQAVGWALDTGGTCSVFEGGFVWPAARFLPQELAGMLEGVNGNGANQEGGAARTGRPAPGSRQRTAGRDSTQGATAAAAGPSFVGKLASRHGLDMSLPNVVRDDVVEVLQAYPQFHVRSTSTAVRLFGTIQPIADLPICSSVVMHHPLNPLQVTTSWAWWSDGVWIGPRHTYQDGSICSYELGDKTWTRGRRLRLLLDLNAMWVARQIFLRAHGRWPGPQRLHTALERLVVHQPGELCGCGRNQLYDKCCRESDLRNVSEDAVIAARSNGTFFRRRVIRSA